MPHPADRSPAARAAVLLRAKLLVALGWISTTGLVGPVRRHVHTRRALLLGRELQAHTAGDDVPTDLLADCVVCLEEYLDASHGPGRSPRRMLAAATYSRALTALLARP